MEKSSRQAALTREDERVIAYIVVHTPWAWVTWSHLDEGKLKYVISSWVAMFSAKIWKLMLLKGIRDIDIECYS